MFEGKNVVITGAGRGIGKVLASGFGRAGASVVVHYAYTKQGAEEVAHEIVSNQGRAYVVQADLRQPSEVARMVAEIHALIGHIDVWINNAGASANSSETQGQSEIDTFHQLMNVDVLGTWTCCREAKPMMREGGSIITLGWDHAFDGAPGTTNQLYAMSKGAIIALTRCLAQEYAPALRVNCIAPGYIENDWARTLLPTTYQHMVQRTPMQRWGTPDDVLQAALFLASPAASFITGQVLIVDGGAVMR